MIDYRDLPEQTLADFIRLNNEIAGMLGRRSVSHVDVAAMRVRWYSYKSHRLVSVTVSYREQDAQICVDISHRAAVDGLDDSPYALLGWLAKWQDRLRHIMDHCLDRGVPVRVHDTPLVVLNPDYAWTTGE
jgi:hypothetical protein